MFLFFRLLDSVFSGRGFFGDDFFGPITGKPRQSFPPFTPPFPSETAVDDYKGTVQVIAGIASYLAHLARADGKFDEEERKLILDLTNKLAKRTLNLEILGKEDKWKESILNAMDDSEVSGILIQLARKHFKLRQALLAFAWQVAAKDGKVTKDEVTWISKIAIEIGANMFDVELSATPYYRLERTSRSVVKAAETLGIPHDAPHEEIEKAFLKAGRKYDPDRQYFASDEEKARLSEIFTEMTEAYKLLTGGEIKEELYGMINVEGQIRPVTGERRVFCFVCGEPNILPGADFISARCPVCQALLVFEKDTAEAIIRYETPELYSLPQPPKEA